MKFLKSNLLFILVIIVSLISRLYLLPERAIFSADEEYQATYAQTLVADFHPIWIGVSAAGTGFYLGPYFTYLTALLLSLSAGLPLLTNYFSALMGVATTALVYYLGLLIGGRVTATLSALLYSLSPLVIFLDQRYWNPSPAMLLTVTYVISLIKAYGNPWWLILTSLTLGSIWHIHLSLAPLYMLTLLIIFKIRRTLTPKIIIMFTLVQLLLLFPLIVFDFNHNFSNLLTPFRLISEPQPNTNSSLSSQLITLGDSLARSLHLASATDSSAEIRPFCPSSRYTLIPPFFSALTLILVLSFFLFAKSRGRNVRLLLLVFAVQSLSALIYPGAKPPYYYSSLFPLFFIALSYTYPRVMVIVTPLILIANSHTLLNPDPAYGLASKKQLISEVNTYLSGSSYNLTEAGECYRYGGWRYLFSTYAYPPNTSSADSWIGWLYPNQIKSPGEFDVVVTDNPNQISRDNALATYSSGGYTAIINKYDD